MKNNAMYGWMFATAAVVLFFTGTAVRASEADDRIEARLGIAQRRAAGARQVGKAAVQHDVGPAIDEGGDGMVAGAAAEQQAMRGIGPAGDGRQAAFFGRDRGQYRHRAIALQRHRPGAMAAIATRMAERKISLEAIIQKRPLKDAPPSPHVAVVLITHATTEASIREALEKSVEDGVAQPKPQVIRIERA